VSEKIFINTVYAIKCNGKLFHLESKIKSWLRLQVDVRCIILSCSVHEVSNWQPAAF